MERAEPARHAPRAPWPEGAGALLLLVPETRALGRTAPGDFTLAADGRLSRKGAASSTRARSSSTPPPSAPSPSDVFSLNARGTALAAEGRLFGTVYPGRWCDAGHPDGTPRRRRPPAGERMTVFALPPGADFPAALVDGLIARYGDLPPEDFARVRSG
jgi:hypothetical protein